MSNPLIHKGVTIALQTNGQFKATVNGTELFAPSVAAMRKKIDKSAPFEKFDAFTLGYYYNEDEITMHKIVGIQKDRGRNSHEFISDQGRRYRWVYRATKENLARAEKFIALKEKHQAIIKNHEKLEEAAKEAIGEQIDPDDLLQEKLKVVKS